MSDIGDRIASLRRRLADAHQYLRIDDLSMRVRELEAELGRPDLWDDVDRARAITGEHKSVDDDLSLHRTLTQRIDDVETLEEMALEEDDSGLGAEIQSELVSLETDFEELELRALFTGEHDEADAVCEIHSGAGGTDAQDWAEMLLRMYSRWAQSRGFEMEIDEIQTGQEAGITTAGFIVKGRHAYGLLRSEIGVHRLVRISPFDAQARRHTAFASMQVIPFFEEASTEIDIDPTDLKIDTYRSSGAGGQHVNVTDSAVRITHLPSGIVVACQNERSQHQNKDRAMQVLAAKLLDRQREERQAELNALAGEQREVAWGSQIRSYTLQPFQLVKDLRSGFEVGNVDGVLDGELDKLMEAYLRWCREEGVAAPSISD